MPAVLPAPLPGVLAHEAAGFWDEAVFAVLLLVIVGAIWLFVRSGGDGGSPEPPPES